MPDPTSREERRRQARPGYDQNSRWNYGEPAAPAAPVEPAWAAKARSEWQGMTRPREPVPTVNEPTKPGGWAGREMDALRASPPGQLVGRAVDRLSSAFGPAAENLAGMHMDDDTRRLRMEQAGVVPPAPPVQTAAAVPEPPLMAPGRPTADRESEANRVYRQPEAVAAGEGGPVRQTTKGSVGVAARGGNIPTTAADAEYINRQPVTVDPRKEYFRMAGMSLEQRNAMLDAMPEGQRPIQTIRGNTEGWYNPALSKEFSGLPQALTGVEGRPTLQSENTREQDARDRVMHQSIADANNATRVQIKGMGEAGQDRREAVKAVKGAAGEKWNVSHVTNPTTGESFFNHVEENSGKNFQVKAGDVNAVTQMLTGLDMNDSKARAHGLTMFKSQSEADSLKAFQNYPNHVRAAILQGIEEEKKQNKKEEKPKK